MLNAAQLLRIDLNLLVLFSAVLEERHVARAAEKLNLTPSAVSHGLRRLRRLLQDPLFLKTPRGVVPTERALALAAPIAEILIRVDSVISASGPFDPKTAERCFSIGAPDAISTVFTTPLLAYLAREAPGIDIRILQLMPQHHGKPTSQVWHSTLAELDAQRLDLVVLPIGPLTPRFAERLLFEEDFVVTTRRGHAFARDPSLKSYLAMRHMLVSRHRRCIRRCRSAARRERLVAARRAHGAQLHDGAGAACRNRFCRDSAASSRHAPCRPLRSRIVSCSFSLARGPGACRRLASRHGGCRHRLDV